MTSYFHTPIPSSPKQKAKAATINSPLSDLDTAIAIQGGGAGAIGNYLKAHWLAAMQNMKTAPTYDAVVTDVIKTVTVYWPDSSEGVYTAVTIDGTHKEATEFTLTHVASGLTLTGSGLVRNGAGQITTPMTLTTAS